MRERILSLLLCIALVLGITACGAPAAENTPPASPSAPTEQQPSEQPSEVPSEVPSEAPTDKPTPSEMPSEVPSEEPSEEPAPSEEPSEVPSEEPAPSEPPSEAPSEEPSPSPVPSAEPTPEPTPSAQPTPEPAPEPEPLINYDPIIDFYEIPFELGEPQYSVDEIQQMISEGLTLDEVAEKISTLADVVQYLHQKGYTVDGGDLKITFSDIQWGINLSAQSIFEGNVGNCGGGSNLLNYILRGDFDEQGYVIEAANQGGHVYNYFKQDGIYYFCDLTEIARHGRFNNKEYRVFATEDPQEFSDYYIGHEHITSGPDAAHYLRLQYMYPYEGNHRPIGRNRDLFLQGPFHNILPQEIEDTLTILYVEEPQFAPIFKPAPKENLWPQEAQ